MVRARMFGDEDMERYAAGFAAQLVQLKTEATVVALSGELGAGKTTFVRGVLRHFGVTKPVTSPTFVIEKIYPIGDATRSNGASAPPNGPFKRIVHVDAYRLDNTDELMKLGWEALLKDPGTLILIEWPERVREAIPENATRLTFTFGDGPERFIEYDH